MNKTKYYLWYAEKIHRLLQILQIHKLRNKWALCKKNSFEALTSYLYKESDLKFRIMIKNLLRNGKVLKSEKGDQELFTRVETTDVRIKPH